jgi:6-phosphogluconolactonase/glucosamine-6-phosphate isomerase/deaminase
MQVFPDQSDVADALANLTLQKAEQAIAERGSFTVALAGRAC